MNNKYWKDMEGMFSIQERLNKLFENTEADYIDTLNQSQYTWTPPFDVYEYRDEYVVKAEVPGVHEGDLDISVDKNTLIVRGERQAGTDVQREYFHLMERRFGKFVRSFVLPHTIDFDKIEAKLKDGVLTINIPKTASSDVNNITIE
ncbi:MAG: Hsp20/alpha crystallin family protein [Candidatus Magnetoovum sp. WYHC-5]|nr:Hsp20/alpha crystallin family protein [Candidatus Magnetoovum sp. WYHC-5]